MLVLSGGLYWGFTDAMVESQDATGNQLPENPPAPNDKSQKNRHGQGDAFVIAPLPISSPALGTCFDRYMFGTQLEYRLTLPKRFGLVAFGGLGEVIPGGNQPFSTKNFS